jgi:hypothetical protein
MAFCHSIMQCAIWFGWDIAWGMFLDQMVQLVVSVVHTVDSLRPLFMSTSSAEFKISSNFSERHLLGSMALSSLPMISSSMILCLSLAS